MRQPPLNRLVASLARQEINHILLANGRIRLRKLTDTITFAPSNGMPLTLSLAELICRRLAKPETARRIVGEARKRLEARS